MRLTHPDDVTRAHDRYVVAGEALVGCSITLDRVLSVTAQALAKARLVVDEARLDRLAASYQQQASVG